MCLPWNHKWETIETRLHEHFVNDDRVPNTIDKIITQRCTHCGKEIVRKYRV